MCYTLNLKCSLPFYVIVVCFLPLLICCSKDPVIPSDNPPSAVRNVLIETFTGHRDGHGAIVSDTFQHIRQRHRIE